MADMMYRLVLRAQFENQAELTKAIEGLNQLQVSGAKVTVQMGGLGRAGTDSLSGLASSVLRLGFMFNMMESALMRQEMATMMAENAQNRLTDAIARYGSNSTQAQRASKQLESEMAYLNNANIRANVSMGLMATQLLLQSKLLDAASLAQIKHAATVIATTIVHWAEVAALQAKALWQSIVSGGLAVPIMVAGAVAGTAALGYYAGSKQEGGFIPKTGLYTLHAGERVLSVKETKETFKSFESGGTIEKEGLYHLHTGEKVLSKESVKTNEVFLDSIKERLEKQNTQTEKVRATSFLSTFKESSLHERTFSTSNVEKSALKQTLIENNKATEKMIVNSFLSATKESNMKNIEKSVLTERSMSLQSSGIVKHPSLLGRESVMPSGGGTTLPTFNFETHLHIETDLDAALKEQNRRIKNEYRRNAS